MWAEGPVFIRNNRTRERTAAEFISVGKILRHFRDKARGPRLRSEAEKARARVRVAAYHADPANKERLNAYQKAYYAANRETILEKRAAYDAEPENKKDRKARQRKYYRRHKNDPAFRSNRAAISKRWRFRHPNAKRDYSGRKRAELKAEEQAIMKEMAKMERAWKRDQNRKRNLTGLTRRGTLLIVVPED